MLLLLLTGCQILSRLTGDPAQAAADAQALLVKGDLAGATAAYDKALARYPTDVDVVSGAAYLRLLMEDAAGAESLLAAAEGAAGPRAGEITLRRALVALDAGDLDRVKTLALASNLPVGKLLAAEVQLADGYRDQGKELLQQVASTPGPVGDTATQYLALINDPNVFVAGLSETQALWALGQRNIAVRSVADLVKAYAESHEDGATQLLLWAGRAAVVGEVAVADDLLDAITVPPTGQGWRVAATRGIARCAEGKGAECQQIFDSLAAGSPADGLADARATAAQAVASAAPDAARALLAGLTGDAAARVWANLGDLPKAASVAADPFFKLQLGG